MNNTLYVINLFGSPGCGKSTIAQLISGLSYTKEVHIEYVNEHAKELVWRKSNQKEFENQILITANQYSRQLWLRENNIHFCVTDSPLLLGAIHQPQTYFQNYEPLLLEMFNSFNNINFFIHRGEFKYDSVGRNENELESMNKKIQLKEFLDKNGITYTNIINNDAYKTATLILSQLDIGL